MNIPPNNPPPAPLVVKVGGDAIDAPEFPELCAALAALHATLPAGLILVHGGGKAVDRHLDRLGLTTQRRDGLRITPPEIMDQITAVLAGSTNTAVVGSLLAAGAPAVGLTLGDGFLTICEPISPGFDVGRVGDVAGGDPGLVRALLEADFLPVIACVGLDRKGRTLNVNADHAARGIARIVAASGLLLLTDVPGILDADRRVIQTIDATTIEALITQGVIAGGMIPKARAAAQAAALIGAPAIVASWKTPQNLLTLAQGHPVGTRVQAHPEPHAHSRRRT